jgi:hypothetical protein
METKIDPLKLNVILAAVAAVVLPAAAAHAQQTRPTTARVQQACLPETDPSSPRHTRLKSDKEDAGEIVRIDVDKDGDPDILERWWNGKRVRWIDEDDNMQWTDVRGDQVNDAMQVDRDGDGYYDGPGDLNIKWCDDDGDGRPDVQIFAANPFSDQARIQSGGSHFMVFIDTDKDGVNGYIDWTNWEFSRVNWRVPPTTSPTHTIPPPNFSPDYMGNSVFLKQHLPAWAITDIRLNWENPFLFYDFDDDGCTEMSLRLLDTTEPVKGAPESGPHLTYRGMVNEAMGGFDLDNDSEKGNEFDFDMSIRFASAADGSHGARIDYSKYSDPHPKMKAPQWVLDGKYFRYDNWRKIEDFCYITHDKAYDEVWKEKGWGECWFVFDEDDDDHRWERVEFYYPTKNYYSTGRWEKGNRKTGGLPGHNQSDTLGDRGEWDVDNSGKGQLYIGAWDRKLHLYGAETGAWTVDYTARFWGSWPVLGNSSPDMAKKVEELVTYEDTDNNGFLDKITYDYDGDEKPDLVINLLDYKTAENPHPDVRPLMDPGKVKWQGLHEAFDKMADDAWKEATRVYLAAWRKGITSVEMDRDLSVASSHGERYDHAYWMKEKVFRVVDKQLAGDKHRQGDLRRAFFTGDIDGFIKVIDALDPMPEKK